MYDTACLTASSGDPSQATPAADHGRCRPQPAQGVLFPLVEEMWFIWGDQVQQRASSSLTMPEVCPAMPAARISLVDDPVAPRRLRVFGALNHIAVGDLLHALSEHASPPGAPPVILDLRHVGRWEVGALRLLERRLQGPGWRGQRAVLLRPGGGAASTRKPETAAEVMRPLVSTVPVTAALHSVLAMSLEDDAELGIIDLSGRIVGHLSQARVRRRIAEDPAGWRHKLCAALLVEHQGRIRADASLADVEAMSCLLSCDSERPFLVLDGRDPVGFLFPEDVRRRGLAP